MLNQERKTYFAQIVFSAMSGWSLWITNSTPLSFILVVVQLLSQDRLFATPWTAARQAFLSFTISQSLLKLVSIESVIPSNHLIFCRPLLLLPSTFPSIRVFSKGLALLIRWSKYWSFSLSISPSSVYSGLISFKLCKPSSINKRQQGDWNTKLFVGSQCRRPWSEQWGDRGLRLSENQENIYCW